MRPANLVRKPTQRRARAACPRRTRAEESCVGRGAPLALRLLVASLAVAFAPAVRAQASGAAARLAAAFPQLFPASTLADAAAAGEMGARLVAPNEAQLALGLQPDDVVLAVGGQRLGSTDWSFPGAQAEPGAAVGDVALTCTVWRTLPGERPVIAPASLARQTLGEFATLPDSERVPMRLACMLANRHTLVLEGAGVVLLPSAGGFDAGRWLRNANPLPQASEAGVHVLAEALVQRAHLEAAPEGELKAAQGLLRRHATIEAKERAGRAMAQSVLDPTARADGSVLAAATQVYSEAAAEQRRRDAVLRQADPPLALVLEGQMTRIQKFLPQKTLMQVDHSTGWGALAGVRVRLPRDDIPVLSNLYLLAEFGQLHNDFDDMQGRKFFAVGLRQYSLEMLYRPRVATRLRPFFRGGAGLFTFTGKVYCPVETTAIDRTEVGALLGGGLDFVRLSSIHLRGSVSATYRILHSQFYPGEAPLLESCAQNVPENVVLERGYYDFDLDGWQLGIQLAFEL